MRKAGPRLAVLVLALALGCDDAKLIEGWQRSAAALRGLDFERPVKVRSLERDEVAASMRRELAEALPPDEMRAYRDAYAALGVLPREADLVALYSDIFGEQLAGRYSPREGALYLVNAKAPGGYARETVAVHELVHALQHQHFPHTLELAEQLRHNDDVVSALNGAIEGDASFTMFGAEDGDPDTQRDLPTARGFRNAMLADLASPSGALARAPLLIQLSLIAPYADGVMFAAQRYLERGNPGLDRLLEDGPLSTAELSDVSRSEGLAETLFVGLPLAALRPALAAQRCELGHHNVAGSLTLRALFEAQGLSAAEAESLARGWHGDRFVRVECPAGAELLWLTFWRSESAAERFSAVYGSIATAVARNAPLAGVPAAWREGRAVVVATPGVASVAELALRSARLERYTGLGAWIAGDCLGEGGCPGRRPRPQGGDASFPLQIRVPFGFKQAPAPGDHGAMGQHLVPCDGFWGPWAPVRTASRATAS